MNEAKFHRAEEYHSFIREVGDGIFFERKTGSSVAEFEDISDSEPWKNYPRRDIFQSKKYRESMISKFAGIEKGNDSFVY